MASHKTTGSLNLQPMNSANYTAAQDGVQDFQGSSSAHNSVPEKPSIHGAGITSQPILDMATASLPKDESDHSQDPKPVAYENNVEQDLSIKKPSLSPPSHPIPVQQPEIPKPTTLSQSIPGKPMSLYIDQKSLSVSPPPRTKSPFRDSSNVFIKQIKDQRRPMYTPAVLRSDSMSRTSSSQSGCDLIDVNNPERPILKSTMSSSSLRSVSSISDYFGSFTRAYGKNIPVEGPTREHWKPNNSRFSCAKCNRVFHFMTEGRRKHHCRYCGDIFCSDCLKNYVYLDESAHFTLFGNSEDVPDDKDKKYLCKVCQDCAHKYEVYLKDHTTRNLDLESNKDSSLTKSSTRKDTVANVQNPMPADWDWSSF
ncbi:hypothetical protein OGAPHI_002069 [Ogataea philodendri]|uniref:FYVE-type domain-containing protein n=1 Tax=Ogataea philodendri TaxID=1378263 RepID=A0A9P8T7L9_9ASCO|nr:uncharacterized protein OGAPHI_002069 [Ogataea philodendri]KAH3668315.1 hypothetical protein OGAPHI_002069 [Ogataea philodendri]